jgi:uncharacterized NAD-dependent epimerase/dehydratase family protein
LASGKRYLILAEGKSQDVHYGKTARGVVRYGPHPVTAVVDSSAVGQTMEGIPVVGTVEEGIALDPRPTTALVGVAVAGGRLPPEWRGILRACIEGGLDVESGMHEFLADDPELAELANTHGVELRDVRKPPPDLSVPTGENLLHGAVVVLTVGSDCAIGKKTVAIELDAEARRRGLRSVFVPTGQTGIMIEGWGIAVDAVVADFIAGAAEWLTLEGSKNADVVLVEGQGSINHPGYSGVTLGLLHGSCPDAMILCHQSTREYIGDYRAAAWLRIPPLTEYVRLYESIGAAVHPTRVIGISLNTYDLSDVEARRACDQAQRETGLPVTDPVRFDPAPLVNAIAEERERYLRRRKAL